MIQLVLAASSTKQVAKVAAHDKSSKTLLTLLTLLALLTLLTRLALLTLGVWGKNQKALMALGPAIMTSKLRWRKGALKLFVFWLFVHALLFHSFVRSFFCLYMCWFIMVRISIDDIGWFNDWSWLIIEGSLKSNFRQYGQMKSRVGQRQREEKD